MDRYKRITVNGTRKKEHRAVWEKAHGPIPKGYEIHHLNGNGHDNRLENLVMLSHADHIRLHTSLRKGGIDPVNDSLPGVSDDRARSKRYCAENKERNSEKCREYRETHKEEILIKAKAYRDTHKEAIAAYQKKYYSEHRKEKADYDRAYREKHGSDIAKKRSEYFKEYREKHKDAIHDKYMRNREETLRRQKEYRDSHREEVRIKDRLWRAIRLKRPQDVIDKIRSELNSVTSKTS